VIPRFFAEPVWWFYLLWLPTYLVQARGFSLPQMGIGAAIPYITADLGCIFGGGVSSFLMRMGWSVNAARKTVMVFCAFLMPAALFVHTAHSGWMAVAFVSIATFGHQGWSTNLLTVPADIFPQRVVGSVTGISGMAICASALGQAGVGWMAQHNLYGPLFTIAGLLHPLAAILMLLILGRIQHVDMKHTGASA
jgi:ACS family hexuronate transporter-like MFS transporter